MYIYIYTYVYIHIDRYILSLRESTVDMPEVSGRRRLLTKSFDFSFIGMAAFLVVISRSYASGGFDTTRHGPLLSAASTFRTSRLALPGP